MSGYRIKPGKGVSALSAAVAVGMGIFGLIFLVPMFSSAPGGMGGTMGAFALLWVIVAFGIAAFYGYNALSERGASFVDIEAPGLPPSAPAAPDRPDFDERLRSLDGLRRDGLIDDAEYDAKRAEILAERW